MHALILAAGLVSSLSTAAQSQSSDIQWRDFDGDERAEALILASDGGLRLLAAADGETFADATLEWGLAELGPVRSVAVSLDAHLLVLLGDSNARLFRLAGSTFTDVTAGSGLDGLGPVASARFLDANRDGHVDIEASATNRRVVLLRGCGDASFIRSELVRRSRSPVASTCSARARMDLFSRATCSRPRRRPARRCARRTHCVPTARCSARR